MAQALQNCLGTSQGILLGSVASINYTTVWPRVSEFMSDTFFSPLQWLRRLRVQSGGAATMLTATTGPNMLVQIESNSPEQGR